MTPRRTFYLPSINTYLVLRLNIKPVLENIYLYFLAQNHLSVTRLKLFIDVRCTILLNYNSLT